MNDRTVRDAIVLAGGASRRMGSNKALLDYQGRPLVRHMADKLRSVFDSVLVVTTDPEIAAAAACPSIADLLPGHGPLGGIHAALRHCNRPIIVVACDMPSLNTALLSHIAAQLGDHHAAVPLHDGFLEPLHAAYSPSCLATFELELQRERARSFATVLAGLDVLTIDEDAAKHFDPALHSYRNWNFPSDIE